MMRNWQYLVVVTLLILGFTTTVGAQDGEVDRIKAILIQLGDVGKKLDSIETGLKNSFPAVAADIAALKKDVADLNASVKDAQLKLQDAHNRIGQLEKQVLQMRNELDAANKRISLYPPSNGKETKSYYPAAVGALLVENRFSQPILLELGGARYRIEPNASRQIEGIPAGPITYSIYSSWGEQRKSSTILANMSLRVNVQ